MDTSFPKHRRLLQPKAFKQVYASKQYGGSQCFTFNVLGGQPETKFGITVSKKVSKRAVDRNRIKRIVKEYIRHHQADLTLAHYVITARVGAVKLTNQELNNNLDDLWQKIQRWQRWYSRQNPAQNCSG